jgi:hypothetical protein
VYKQGEKYFVNLENRTIELVDNLEYLERFASNEPIESIMQDASIWSENLHTYAGFVDKVVENVAKIKQGVCLI